MTISVTGAYVVAANAVLDFEYPADQSIYYGVYDLTGASSSLSILGSVTFGYASYPNSAAPIRADAANTTLHIGVGGSVTLSGSGGADAFYAYSFPATFINDGTLTVSGLGGAYGAELIQGGTFSNSGVITVTQSSGFSTGVDCSDNGGVTAFLNTGTITADTAVITGNGHISLTNSGALNGAVMIGLGQAGGDQIYNAGTINGLVQFNVSSGSELYDGRGGSQTGGIVFSGSGGTDTVYLGNDGETVTGGGGVLIATGGTGADTITGGSANDTIDGGGGDDLLNGGGGVNTVSYASATAGVTVSLASQGSAQNTIGAGSDTLTNFQNLAGSAFADTLTGDASANVINGGGGNDTLTGGLGADTFVMSQAGGAVTITDFSHAQGDKVDLSSLYRYISLAGLLATATQVNADTVIDLGGGNAVTLKNIAKTSLTASDFVFTPAAAIQVDAGTVSIPSTFSLSLTSGPLVQFTASSGGVLVNNGTLTLTTSGSGVVEAVHLTDASNATALIRNYGSISISAIKATFGNVALENYGSVSISGADAMASGPGGSLTNAGSISATDSAGAASAEMLGSTGFVHNLAGATLSATSNFGAITVSMLKGGELVNAGTITASGQSSIGVDVSNADLGLNAAYAVINNSGTITASGSGAVGIKVDYLNNPSAIHNPGAGEYNLVNSGVITAPIAIQFVGGYPPTYPGQAAAIHNTGTINGAVQLSEQNDVLVNAGAINGAIGMGDGNDSLVNTGTITGAVNLGNGADTLDSHAGTIAGVITLGSGSSTVTLGAEDNTVSLGAGTHVVDGGGGINTVSYLNGGFYTGVTVNLATHTAQSTGAGTDTLSNFQNVIGTASADHITGDAGNNVIDGGGGDGDVLDGGGGFNTVSFASAQHYGVTVNLGQQGHSQNTGPNGNETLSNFQAVIGSAFNDVLEGGGSASTTLTGGLGFDQFVYRPGDGAVTVTDFSHAQHDRIDLSAFSQFTSLSDVMASAYQVGADTVINMGSGSLTLKNVQETSLTASDFVLPHLQINVTYDPSTYNAPPGFTAAVNAAVQFFESTITSNITINLAFGWGEAKGNALQAGSVGQNQSNYDNAFTYQELRSALAAGDAGWAPGAAAVAGLPTSDPTNSAAFVMTTAEEKALGLYTGSNSTIDGWIGLSSTAKFAFDSNNRAVSGAYDAVGAIEHEISEVLGRDVLASLPVDVPGYGTVVVDQPLDLFRYSAPGVRTFAQGSAFFSLDGTTALKYFADGTTGADDGDWASGGQVDAFDANGQKGLEADVSPVDLQVMALLGYRLSPTALNGATPPPGNQILIGTAGSDWLHGAGGNDTLHGGSGSDNLDGGAGVNTATYDGVYRQYTVGAGGLTVSGGPEGGTDNLGEIQRIQFADGYLAVSPTDTAGQVYRLYEAALGRGPDAAGLAGWTRALNAGGVSLQTVAAGFVGSAEFHSTYGSLDNTQFITLLYNNVLHRGPDQGGLTGWLGYMAQGHSQADVLLGFSESAEDINDLAAPVQQGLWIGDPNAGEAARLYDTVFGREPDTVGLPYWIHALDGGMSLQTAANGFVASPEFQAAYAGLDDTGFLTKLYHNVLHRDPDAGGLSGWLGYLGQGHTRADVVLGFSDSAEHVANTAPHVDNGIWVI